MPDDEKTVQSENPLSRAHTGNAAADEPPLPFGWSRVTEDGLSWFEYTDGRTQWDFPVLPAGWSIESEDEATWFVSPAGDAQWTWPSATV